LFEPRTPDRGDLIYWSRALRAVICLPNASSRFRAQ